MDDPYVQVVLKRENLFGLLLSIKVKTFPSINCNEVFKLIILWPRKGAINKNVKQHSIFIQEFSKLVPL